MSRSTAGKGEGTYFRNSKGKQLYVEIWRPAERPSGPRKLAFFFHGVHESADTSTVQALAELCTQTLGMEFACMEHHGHGRSYGWQLSAKTLLGFLLRVLLAVQLLILLVFRNRTRALVESFDLLCDDAMEFIAWYVESSPSDRFCVIGHSMGGAVVTWMGDNLMAEYKERLIGCILLAPSLSSSHPVSNVTSISVSAMSVLAPWAPIGPPDNVDASRSASEAAAYKASPLHYLGKMRVRTVRVFLHLFARTDNALDRGLLKLAFPFVILHGDQDPTVHIQGSQRLLDAALSSDKTLVSLEGEGHQPLCTEGRRDVLDAVANWLRPRL